MAVDVSKFLRRTKLENPRYFLRLRIFGEINLGNPYCFVMMPVSTPERLVESYAGDKAHFFHILEHVISPAVKRAGFDILLPTVEGSLVIHSEIIRRLCVAEMALADMSSLNANVFFELGVRTAINKPVAIIRDEKTTAVPFDASIINYVMYSSSASAWEIETQIDKLAQHIKTTFETSNNSNPMWKAFSGNEHISALTSPTSSSEAELAAIRKEMELMRRAQAARPPGVKPMGRAHTRPMDVFFTLQSLASDAGYFIDYNDSSVHSIDIRMNRSKPLSKIVKNQLIKVGESYGFRITFTQ